MLLAPFNLRLARCNGSYRGNGPQRLVAWNPERIGNAFQACLQGIQLVTLPLERHQI